MAGNYYAVYLRPRKDTRWVMLAPAHHDDTEPVIAVITSMASRIYGRRHSKERAEKIKACVEQVMKQEENA